MTRTDDNSATEGVTIADARGRRNRHEPEIVRGTPAAPAKIVEKLRLYAQLARLDRPIGSVLLMWPTLWALWIASGGNPSWHHLAVFIAGTFLMRSAGCAVNDYADRDFDLHVERTANRPVTSGLISGREALLVAAFLSALALVLVVTLNLLAIALSVVALAVAATYPYTKRFFPIPQAYLGVAFGFGIPMAFAAEMNTVPPMAWLMLLANVFWAVAYDTEYAMVDRDDDLEIGIRSSAITFGRSDVAAVMLCYAITLLLLAAAMYFLGRGVYAYGGIGLAATIAGYHYLLIRDRSREGCFAAFRHNNWFGAVIFAGIFLDFRIG